MSFLRYYVSEEQKLIKSLFTENPNPVGPLGLYLYASFLAFSDEKAPENAPPRHGHTCMYSIENES